SAQISQLVAAFSKCSPASQQKFKAALQIDPSTTIPTSTEPTSPKFTGHSYSPSASSLLLTTEQELPALADSSDFSFGIHNSLIDLGRASLHIPLSMHTSASTRKLFIEDSSLKRVTIHIKDNQKVFVIDRAQFPSERSLTLAEFHEAYARFLIFLETWYSKSIAERWSTHYRFCCKQEDMADIFPAILLFDVEERTS
ncbi:hypothetical protein BJ138DRAFT_988667, partial [Hygrophoropsis aurantiaca]